ncbi:paraquat-inducible protein A [Rhodoferax sp.]|uniref:paraquat-inducible protein A n=1 Tax=Rhodoferax sp. TaxID=50421 RepID=UPI00374DA36D
MQLVPHAIVCEGCDAVHQKTTLACGETARCVRCGTELDRYTGNPLQRILPLVVAALVMFAVANLFPIVSIAIGGQHSETTLFGAVVALTDEGMAEVAALVLATTLLFPLLQLLILLYLLLPLSRQRRPVGFALLVRALQSLQPWGMVEVFLLGVLVAIVKLTSAAEVIAGPALGAFVALTVLLTAVLSFQPRNFWHMAFDPQDGTA